LTSVFFAVLGIMFSGSGGNATDFFGSSLFLVREQEFDLVRTPAVVIGQRVENVDDLRAGHLVLMRSPESGVVALVELGEDFALADDFDPDNIVAKAVQTSRFFGYILVFATSPAGVFVIVVLPCIALIVFELTKQLFKRKTKEVEPVNKQDETPTFVPIGRFGEQDGKEDGLRPSPRSEPRQPPKVSGVKVKPEVALAAYKDIANLGTEQDTAPDLFVAPEKPAEKSPEKPPETSTEAAVERLAQLQSASAKKKPLSSAKLAEVIANLEQAKTQQEKGEEI